jgi:hypothetical protein
LDKESYELRFSVNVYTLIIPWQIPKMIKCQFFGEVVDSIKNIVGNKVTPISQFGTIGQTSI